MTSNSNFKVHNQFEATEVGYWEPNTNLKKKKNI